MGGKLPADAWSLRPRQNAASRFPSDFDIVACAELCDAMVQALRADARVSLVTPERRLQNRRPLVEERVGAEEEEAEEEAEGEANKTSHSFYYPGRRMTQWDVSSVFLHRTLSRALPPGSLGVKVVTALGAEALWARGFTGRGVRVGIFDTGLREEHPHFRHIAARSDWTDESTKEDGLGHGTFVAGVVASQSDECPGFAPEAELHAFRVFTNSQVTFTSWFLDALNYAMHTRMDVVNLSIGGPDFLDTPFVDKVNELTANGIIMVSAIGNDGPVFGTLNNPADQNNVIGVGGVDDRGRVAPFSSRGMTNWELPGGYGRFKPDIVAYGVGVFGSHMDTGCRSLSGTSVASPVVAGAVTLLASVLPPDDRRRLVNPASMKQAIMHSATRSPHNNIFEQVILFFFFF